MKNSFATLFTIILICCAASPGWSQCEGYITEETPPPAVSGMATTEPGFTVHYWSWNEYATRNGGSDRPHLGNFDGGIMLQDMEWTTAENCQQPGQIPRTAVLFESLDAEGFGRWALVNIGGTYGEGADVDYLQFHLGQVSSKARSIPAPRLDTLHITESTLTLDLSWVATPDAEALSDLTDPEGAPLSSVRGWAIYLTDTSQPTPNPTDWIFAPDLEADNVNGYSTNTSARISLPRDIWHDQSICLALAPTFDGNGDAGGQDPLHGSVQATYLGHPSQWLALPAEDAEGPVHIGSIKLHPVGHGVFNMEMDSPNELSESSYRISLLIEGLNPFLLKSIEGGYGHYEIEVQFPPWAFRRRPHLLVEMLDHAGHLVDSREISRFSDLS